MRRAMALAAGALLAFPAVASADATIQAIDPAPGQGDWSPKTVTVKPGATVTWTFTSGFHNAVSSGSNWTLTDSGPVSNHAPESYTFTVQDTYEFYCQAHPGQMRGTVVVTDAAGNPPPPPPPPPLSEQPFPNDQSPPGVLELSDTKRPRLTGVRASRIARGVRVRFHLSEPGRVTVRVRRGDRVVRAKAVRLRRAATRGLNVRGLAAGAYRVELSARDSALNRSKVKRVRVSVR